ncbi:MAG: class I SAM-dependent rRNA methyltransferase [Bacteroidales bacterium]|nr:class I SAM-dependent rRNA methyltransferase [Bacteroidales bacterium]
MQEFPKVYLKPGRDHSLKRFHLWVFSGAIKGLAGKPEEGDIVEVVDSSGNYLATGHIQNGSISVRIISFEQTDAGKDFWKTKFEKAFEMRKSLGFFNNPDTNVFRLVHGEGDGFPGLIVDFYNGVVVIQAHSVGMWRHRKLFAEVIKEILGETCVAVYDKSEATLHTAMEEEGEKFLVGKSENVLVKEYGNSFEIDFQTGQKTGFFIDQRESRKLLGNYCKGKKVANIFSYTGGFSVYAAASGATVVDSLDSSEKAIELAKKNMELNFGAKSAHHYFAQDAFEFFKKEGNNYDVIVLDPPAFAKHKQALNNALKAYRRINEAAIRNLNANGILFAFSCSQVVSKDDFRKTIFEAAANTGRSVKILHQLTQPADHPINIYHPEGEYLKGLVLFVE